MRKSMKKIKQTRKRKRSLSKEDRLKWLAEHPKSRGRPSKMYTDLLTPLTQETADGLLLACYQIMLSAPEDQKHLAPNVRTITLRLPWNFRTLYTRAFPHGLYVGESECKWFVLYRVKVSLLYDFMFKKGFTDVPRTDFTLAVRSVKMELVHLERQLEDLIPVDVLEKMNNKIQEVVDTDNKEE